jgi:hypothetical protein
VSVDAFIREFTAWESLFKATAKLPGSAPGGFPDKGKVFERLTQLYLRTSPEYQSKLRHVWRAKEELPPDLRARIRLPPGDEGIDLVAQTFDGEFLGDPVQLPDGYASRPDGRRVGDLRQSHLQRLPQHLLGRRRAHGCQASP